MTIMKVLSIGNSFSEDAQAYLKGVCDAAEVEVYNVNLFVGGCTLLRHYNNLTRDIPEYRLDICGVPTDRRVTVKEALAMEEWDVVTLQEASARSAEICHFEPYIYEIIKYIKEVCPRARIALHQTWGYGENLLHRMKHFGCYSAEEMFETVERVYREVFRRTGADILIPSGRVFLELYRKGYNVHYEDGQHSGRGLGRYALALTWCRTLFGIEVSGNTFRDFEVPLTDGEIRAAWETIDGLDI